MGQAQSTQHGGNRTRDISKLDDSELDFDITKKIKTEEEAAPQPSGIILYICLLSCLSNILMVIHKCKTTLTKLELNMKLIQ